MTEKKLRRTSFLSTMGMAAFGWLGTKSSKAAVAGTSSQGEKVKLRVSPDPRSVPCDGRTP